MSKNLADSNFNDYTGIAVVKTPKASHSGNISEEAMEGIREYNNKKINKQRTLRHNEKKALGITKRNKYTGIRATKYLAADFFNDPENEINNDDIKDL